jgi:hypothetical protein
MPAQQPLCLQDDHVDLRAGEAESRRQMLAICAKALPGWAGLQEADVQVCVLHGGAGVHGSDPLLLTSCPQHPAAQFSSPSALARGNEVPATRHPTPAAPAVFNRQRGHLQH